MCVCVMQLYIYIYYSVLYPCHPINHFTSSRTLEREKDGMPYISIRWATDLGGWLDESQIQMVTSVVRASYFQIFQGERL